MKSGKFQAVNVTWPYHGIRPEAQQIFVTFITKNTELEYVTMCCIKLDELLYMRGLFSCW